MMDRTWYEPLGDHAAKWNVKPKDSQMKLCPHILAHPVRRDSGHVLDIAARYENKAVQGQDKHDRAQYGRQATRRGSTAVPRSCGRRMFLQRI